MVLGGVVVVVVEVGGGELVGDRDGGHGACVVVFNWVLCGVLWVWMWVWVWVVCTLYVCTIEVVIVSD